MSGPVERHEAEALAPVDRLALAEARLDRVDERLAERPRPWPAMSDAEARWLHQRDLVAGFVAAFVAVVAALTVLGYWAISAVTS